MNIKEAQTALESIADLIRWAASHFAEAELTYGHGTENALDEAYFIVCRALHLPLEFPQYMLECKTTPAERKHILELVNQRITRRTPAAYLLKEAWFAGLRFYVDERVIVPRSPLAEMIDQGFAPWIDPERVDTILDLCTGSGCIAIACAYAFNQATIYAADISEAALEVATRNVEAHKLSSTINLVQSDVFASLDPHVKYDVIVSNPPYVNAVEMGDLSEEYQHEPRLALSGGDDGLDVVKMILRDAVDYLNPDGVLVIEVGNSADTLIELYPKVPFVWPEFEKGGHGVFVLGYDDLLACRDELAAERTVS